MISELSDWRTSNYSGPQGNCVEVAVGPVVGVRDTKDRSGGTLMFGRRAWTNFLARLRSD